MVNLRLMVTATFYNLLSDQTNFPLLAWVNKLTCLTLSPILICFHKTPFPKEDTWIHSHQYQIGERQVQNQLIFLAIHVYLLYNIDLTLVQFTTGSYFSSSWLPFVEFLHVHGFWRCLPSIFHLGGCWTWKIKFAKQSWDSHIYFCAYYWLQYFSFVSNNFCLHMLQPI